MELNVLLKFIIQIQWQNNIFLVVIRDEYLKFDNANKFIGLSIIFELQQNIYHIFFMSHFFVKYGEEVHLTLPPFTNISLKIIYFVVAVCVPLG